MARMVIAPEEHEGKEYKLFLAGGITGCPDWQAEMASHLADEDIILLNPRRKYYQDNEKTAEEQIGWEHRYLRKADAILFWFPQETPCPITLYELGAWSMTDKQLFIGTHQAYSRRHDVQYQTKLARPDLKIHRSLEELGRAVQAYLREERPSR